MRYLLIAVVSMAALLGGGCKSLGYNPQSLDNQLTPSGGEQTYVRTWKTDPQTGQTTPVVEKK